MKILLRVQTMSLIAFMSLASNYLYAQEETTRLSQVIVTATGFEQNADNNLRHVHVINGEEITNRGYTSVEQALGRLAGVNFVRIGTGGQASAIPDMRGQGTSANRAVKVMLDGVTMNIMDENRLHSAGVQISPLDSINMEEIERIEIIPGGGSVLYGGGTRGGVINIITKTPNSTGASLAYRINTFERNSSLGQNASLAAQLLANDKYGIGLNLDGFNTKGYRIGDKNKGFHAKLKSNIQITDSQKLKIGLGYYQSEDKSSSTLTKTQVESNPKQQGSNVSSFTANRPEINAEYKIAINDRLDFDINGFWQQQKHKINDEDRGLYSAGDFKDTITGSNLKFKYNYFDNSYLIMGYTFEQHNSKGNSTSFVGNVTNNDTRDTHAIFYLIRIILMIFLLLLLVPDMKGQILNKKVKVLQQVVVLIIVIPFLLIPIIMPLN